MKTSSVSVLPTVAAWAASGRQMRRRRGFTLIEVMVALAIVAVALPALLTTLYQQADDTAYLRDKSLARMVAANKLQELRLGVARSGQMRASKENGEARMAEREWFWWVDITNAPNVPQIFRVDIRVGQSADNPEQSLYTLSAFISGDRRSDTSGGIPGQPGAPNPGDPDPANPDPAQPGRNPVNSGGASQEMIDALENARGA